MNANAADTWGEFTLVGFLLLGVLVGVVVIVVFLAAFFHGMKNPHPANPERRAVRRRPVVASPVARRHDPLATVSEPSAAGHMVRVVGWTATVVAFFLAWLWCVSRYPIGDVDDGILAIFVGVGLLVLAVVADFVRSLFRSRMPGDQRQWYFLSPAGGSFTGRLLIGGVVLGLCVLGTILLSNAIGFDLNALNQPPPQRYLPYIRLIGFGVVTAAMGFGAVASIRRRNRRGKVGLPAMPAELPKPIPLTAHQRKVLFWAFFLLMALAVLSMLDQLFSKMGFGCASLLLGSFIVSASAALVFGIREWAFKKKPDDATPLPVAPLILTPDPTPGGSCPTCGNAIPPGSPQGLCPRCLIRGAFPSPSVTHDRQTRPIDPPPPAEVNEFFPQLEVLELIGAGGMGAVYKVRQPTLDRVVALKIVQSPRGDDDPVFAERFAREARAMAKLDHPNIVTIHESGESGGLPYLVMEYVDGITLRDAMANKVLSTSEALAVIPQICDALDYAHKNGVVHRDIKPENILIDQTGRVKIADFGLAKLAEAGGMSLTHTKQAMGTPHYMAPEQWERPSAVDHRADIYALGVVLYELLTGELPLGRFDLPSQKGFGNARLDQVVLRALAKEPGQRYQHASEMKTALSGLGNGGFGPWVEPRTGRTHYEYRSKRRFLGLPLVHVVRGRNPATGKLRVAKGWIAVSDGLAVGGVAVGGTMAVGGITLAGVFSVGLLAVGGAFGVGLLALAGTAVGFLAAVGGVAISPWLAVGGLAIGTFAIGGLAIGSYTLGGTGNHPEFWDVLRWHIPNLLRW